ncbi:hypothetical protein [Streptomyces sp. NPDC048442]|uniref:hypothetical protein n=1 Tax=Streptomyces sp. NPDC048442 TaxID=3154823 RepID=UPI0034348A37
MTTRRKKEKPFEPGTVPVPGGLLDWGDPRHFHSWQDRPCALCRQATRMRSHSGEPAHKVCAESWIAANPTEARLGRFANDAQAKRRDTGHA